MTINIELLRQQAFDARSMYAIGQISREEAKEMIVPYIAEFNLKSTEIAKKYKQKPKKISFSSFIR